MSEDQSEEKTDPASERKLRKLREDAIIPTSQMGTNFVGFAAGFGVLLLLLRQMIDALADGFDTAFASLNSEAANDEGLVWYFLIEIHSPVAMVMLAVLGAGILFRILVNKGFVFSLKQVSPSLDKVNPVTGFKNLFKGRTLTEFAATLTRFLVLLGTFGFLAWFWWPTLANLDLCSPACALPVAWDITKAILIATAALLLVSVAFDVGIQQAFFLMEHRMTKTEVKKELKEMLGQPEVRQERNRLRRDSAAMAGSVGVAAATVYFHYGDRVVALAFDPVKNPLPKIAAKSREARRTIEILQDLNGRGVPGMEDEQIVEACELVPNGSPVPRAIFAPLATRLRYLLG
ncbi:MAG: EscU/YscU/HrcU family type III secretion system export apparatus switch protein [Pseudomonadota bacterium]